MDTAYIRTRINTVLVYACQVSWTLCIDNTFWLTLNIWIAGIVSNASTTCGFIHLITYSIDATWRWVTWFYYLNWQYSTLKNISYIRLSQMKTFKPYLAVSNNWKMDLLYILGYTHR